MKIHEYQGKQLFKEFGVPCPDGIVAFTVDEAVAAADKLPGTIMLSLGPAEEQLASRPFLVRAGYLKDVDAGR